MRTTLGHAPNAFGSLRRAASSGEGGNTRLFLDALKVRYLARIAVQKALAKNPIGLQDQTAY